MGQRFAELAARCQGDVITPQDPRYEQARAVWNGSIQRQPAAILRCGGVADVRAAVRYARENGLPLAVRAGGHNVAGLGTCEDGLVLDLRAMRGIRVDPAARRAWTQGGAVWGEFDRQTQEFGLATPGGVVSTTGVGAAESFTSPASDIKLVPMGGPMGGRARRAREDASAFGHHDARILFAAGARWSGPSGPVRHVAWARDLWAGLRRLADGVYVNFLGEEGDERVREAYGTRAYQRLAALKDRWDPDNVFRVNQNITPSHHERKEG